MKVLGFTGFLGMDMTEQDLSSTLPVDEIVTLDDPIAPTLSPKPIQGYLEALGR